MRSKRSSVNHDVDVLEASRFKLNLISACESPFEIEMTNNQLHLDQPAKRAKRYPSPMPKKLSKIIPAS